LQQMACAGFLLESVSDQGWYRAEGEGAAVGGDGMVGGDEGEDSVGVDAGAASQVDDQLRRRRVVDRAS